MSHLPMPTAGTPILYVSAHRTFCTCRCCHSRTLYRSLPSSCQHLSTQALLPLLPHHRTHHHTASTPHAPQHPLLRTPHRAPQTRVAKTIRRLLPRRILYKRLRRYTP